MHILTQYRTYVTGLWLVAGLAVASNFNACSEAVFTQSASSLKMQMQSSAIILINQDAPYTNNKSVLLSLQSDLADEVYVTNQPGCNSGGSWEKLSPTKAWTLHQVNRDAVVYARFRNQYENISTACLSDAILHDEELPVISLEKKTFNTNVNAPIFNFLAADQLSGLDRTMCRWPGKVAELCAFSSSNGALAEGRYLIDVIAYDRAGNVSDPVKQDILVDRTKPVVTLLSVPPKISNQMAAQITYSAHDALSGVQSVECAWDNPAQFVACASPASNNLAQGAHTFYIRATDNSGNQSDVVSYGFTVDLSAPQVNITSGPPDFTNATSATFAFNGNDDGVAISVFECRVDSGAWSSCASPKSYTGLSESLHKFEVRGRDNAGNFSSPANRSWFVDLTPPAISLVQTPEPLSKSPTAVYRYSITDAGSGVATVQCSLDGAPLSTCAIDSVTYSNLANGAHGFRVRATDKAGSAAERTHSFSIDRVLPTISFTNVPAALSNITAFNFGFQASDNVAVARVECSVDAGPYSACNSSTSHNVTNLTEGGHIMNVRAVDTAENVSVPATASWSIDLTGPEIKYFQVPAAVGLTTSVISLGFTAEDQTSGLSSLTCELNGTITSCTSGTLLNFPNLQAGNYTFKIIAEDKSGNVTTDLKTWKINAPVLKTQLAKVNENRKLDILVIVDNSGSMSAEQKNMGTRFANFIDHVQDLDWQIGIITTDVSANKSLRDGRLVALDGLVNQYIITPAMGLTVAQQIFSDTVQMSTNGSASEYGVKAAIRAIQRSQATDTVSAPNRALFRDGAVLSIIVVSDATDDSGVQPEDLIDLVDTTWSGDKPFSFHSLVIPESEYTKPSGGGIDANDPCGSYRESVKLDGRIYHRLSALTGGIQGTACSSDYSAQLSDMGRSTADLVNSVTLTCLPVDANADGAVNAQDVVVTTGSGGTLTDLVLNGNKVTFGSALPIGNNSISYYCVE